MINRLPSLSRNPQLTLLFLVLLLVGFAAAGITAKLQSPLALVVISGIAMFVLAFIRTDWAFYALILSMLLSPEIAFGGMSEEGVSGERAIVVRLDDFLLLILMFAWLAKAAVFKEIGLLKKTPINSKIFYYTVAFTFSTAAGILYGDVSLLLGLFNILKFIQYFLLFFIVVNNLESEAQARTLVKVVIFTCVIISLYGISQIPSGTRVTTPFEGEGGEPNTLGGYLVLMLSITGGLFLESKDLMKRFGYGIISLFGLVT